MTLYMECWKEMERICKSRARQYRKKGNEVMARFYYQQAKNAVYMQKHESQFSEDEI